MLTVLNSGPLGLQSLCLHLKSLWDLHWDFMQDDSPGRDSCQKHSFGRGISAN